MTVGEIVCVLVVLSSGFLQVQGTCPANCKGGKTCDDADSGCPECKHEYYGRQCEFRTECRYTNLGQEYRGKRNTTKSGLTCQRWDTQKPHSHKKNEEENYCRNPDRDSIGPWCYTVDPKTRYQSCDIPMCNTQCPRPTLFLYGDVINPPAGGFAVDFTVEDVSGGCGIGKQGNKTCQKDLKWSPAFDCKDIPWCPKPIFTDPNFITATKTDYYFNESVTSLCRDGYEIVGNAEITCQADKTWTRVVLQCTRVNCNKPVLNDHSVIRFGDANQTYVYEDEITVECTSGYETNHQVSFKCQANRNWNGSMPKCNAVHCENPVLNENSVIYHRKSTYVYLDTVNITCRDGYNLVGERLFTCRADKTWSGAFPTCEPVPCQKPKLPQKSNTTLNNTFVFMDTVNIECIRGFSIKSNSVITCLANMTWGTIPECTIVVCNTPPLPAKGSIIKGENTTYLHRHELTLGCQEGYTYEGSGITTCLYTGLWEESNGKCVSTPSKVEAAVGSTFGVLIVIAIAGGIVFVLARRRRKRKQNDELITSYKREKEINDTEGTDENYVGVYESNVCFELTSDASEDDIYINVDTDTATRVVQISELTEYFSSKMAEETYFEKEFSELISGLQRPYKEACKQKNSPKNKYKNIYPYDDNRISLKKIAGLPESDFINASPIKGYEGETIYVAAQGPSHVTVDDFWRMVWELDSGQIVMLTNLEEDGRRKCERYWPEENATRSGDIIIELLDVREYSDFVIRHLDISKDKCKRKIYHFQFTAWPEDRLPDCASTVSFFREKVISAPCDLEGPTIVHGSAGIGRTGVFIAFDYLMKEAEITKSVNVFNCVQRLREQRIQMVRTREQYEFIYMLLIEEFEIENSTVAASDFVERFEKLKTRNAATGNTFLQDQFNILMKTPTVHVQEDFKDSNLSVNKSKNRYADIVPVDRFRPRLSGKGDDTGAYINAVFLPSFRKQGTYLVTQMPLPNTVEDFWSLVYEQNVAIIVMLNGKDDRSCGIYWPKDTKGQVQFGPFSVSLIQAEQNGNIITKTMKLEKEGVLDISRTVHQYQITDWPDNECVPTVESILNIIDTTITALKDKDQAPVVVHCMNGAEKSGLFCTIMTVLERLLIEDDVAIIPIVKHMRSRRPQFIPNVEQFRFCHEVARQRLFGIYSNMNFETQ